MWPEIEAGNIKPVVHAVLPIAQAGQAHALMAADENFGKIVLSVG